MSNGSAAKRNTLTTPEWIVMSALWGREPQVLGEIIETIGDRVDWSYTTYASYMKILSDKGYVGFTTRGRMKFYYAAVIRRRASPRRVRAYWKSWAEATRRS